MRLTFKNVSEQFTQEELELVKLEKPRKNAKYKVTAQLICQDEPATIYFAVLTDAVDWLTLDYPNQKYNDKKFDDYGYDDDGYDVDGYNPDGYDREGYDEDGFDIDGYDCEGYDEDGFNKLGYNYAGYDSDGYDCEGYDEDGFDIDGYNSEGYDEDGFDIDGYDRQGYDEDGFYIDDYKEEEVNSEGNSKYSDNDTVEVDTTPELIGQSCSIDRDMQPFNTSELYKDTPQEIQQYHWWGAYNKALNKMINDKGHEIVFAPAGQYFDEVLQDWVYHRYTQIDSNIVIFNKSQGQKVVDDEITMNGQSCPLSTVFMPYYATSQDYFYPNESEGNYWFSWWTTYNIQLSWMIEKSGTATGYTDNDSNIAIFQKSSNQIEVQEPLECNSNLEKYPEDVNNHFDEWTTLYATLARRIQSVEDVVMTHVKSFRDMFSQVKQIIKFNNQKPLGFMIVK